MPGRHRKTTPARSWWAVVAAAVTLALATAVPALAVVQRGPATAHGEDRSVRATGRAPTAAAARATTRALARSVSRSFSRIPETDLLAARLAATEQSARVAARAVREKARAKRHRTVRPAFAAAPRDVPSGVSGKPCPDGSAVESGLVSNTIEVYRAVCAAFPSVSAWGGRSGSGNHGAGRALDVMVTGSTGDAIAAYVRANAGALGVSEVIWSQRIWTVQRAGEGWRSMENRGSSTANHYDHVHVSVF